MNTSKISAFYGKVKSFNPMAYFRKDEYDTQLGNIETTVSSSVYDGKIGNTDIILDDDGVLCTVAGEDREKFIKEMQTLITKYQI